MEYNKQYKFEVFHRDSFSGEKKKYKKKLIIFLSVAFAFIISIFIRGCYLDKIRFEEKVEGVLVEKKLGSRGSYSLKLYSRENNNTNSYLYNNFSNYNKLKIGDSVFKHFNSHIVKLYRKKNDAYIFIDSFSIKRW